MHHPLINPTPLLRDEVLQVYHIVQLLEGPCETQKHPRKGCNFNFQHLCASTCSSWAPVFCPLFFVAPHGTSMALTFVPLHSVSLTDPTPSLTSQQLRHNVVPRSGATRHFWTSVPWIKLEHGILEVCVVWLEGCHRNGINDGNESFPRLK